MTKHLRHPLCNIGELFRSVYVPGEAYIKIDSSQLAQRALVSWTSPYEDNVTITLYDDQTILLTRQSIPSDMHDVLFSIHGYHVTRSVRLPGRGKSYGTYTKQCNEIGLKYFKELIAVIKQQKIKFNGVPIRSASRH